MNIWRNPVTLDSRHDPITWFLKKGQGCRAMNKRKHIWKNVKYKWCGVIDKVLEIILIYGQHKSNHFCSSSIKIKVPNHKKKLEIAALLLLFLETTRFLYIFLCYFTWIIYFQLIHDISSVATYYNFFENIFLIWLKIYRGY